MQLPFRLVAVDYEAVVIGKVGHVGISTLDSEDVVANSAVVVVEEWEEKIRGRSLVVASMNDPKHEHPM
jgi:hypothetical protein